VTTPPIRKFTITQNVDRHPQTGLLRRLLGRLKGRGSRGPSGRRGPRRRPKDILTYAAIILAALFLAGTLCFIGLFIWVAGDLPDPDNISQRSIAQTTKIFDRTGEHVLYEVHGEEKRTVVDLDEISPHVIHATIAAEDKDFYQHKGFSLRGFIRAFLKNLLRGGRGQGGSTITQQFVKNSILSPEKTYIRKLKELVLSIEIERRFDKDQILKLYLNEIPYGSVTYGIESAAQSFFGKGAQDLTIEESAMLASLPKATTYYSPYGSHRDELAARTRSIIDIMAAEGYITEEEAAAAKEVDVVSQVQPRRETIAAPHFVFYVRELLADEYGEQLVERGGLRVITTLDMDLQTAAEEAIAANLERIQDFEGSTAAQLALDPQTGDILSMVGSADYFDDEIDGKFNAILGLRQPGSSIKPMVYAAAFEKGYTPDTVLYDVETQFSRTSQSYRPRNYDLIEHGAVTVRQALAGSLNIPAVKMLYLAGVDTFLDFSRPFGYTTFGDRSRFGLSLVLGGGEVKPLEHIAAFSAFANEGSVRQPRALLRVEDRDGNVMYEAEEAVSAKRVMEKETARNINAILSDNDARAFAFGEHNYLTLGGRPVAAKTGTTNGYKDAWTIGYTPTLVSGVWVGNADGSEMKLGAAGGTVAAPIWNTFMRAALEGQLFREFTAPEPIVTGKPILDGERNAQAKVRVDVISGKLATEYTPEEYVEERGFGQPHSILFFVDKDDPRGPIPDDPTTDPQFGLWEEAIAAWSEGQGFSSEPPPTEYDDVHIPENLPTVTLLNLQEGSEIAERSFLADIRAEARRGVAKVEYLMDGEIIETKTGWPHGGSVTVPNRYGKGFHQLTVAAYDDVGNRGETTITVNLTAPPGPLGVQWSAPWNGQNISASAGFPFQVRFRIDDPQSIRTLSLIAVSPDGIRHPIGSIHDPVLPNMLIQWQDAPPSGRYELRVEAELTGGEIREEGIPIYIY